MDSKRQIIGIFEMTTSNALRYNSELLEITKNMHCEIKIYVDDSDDCETPYEVNSRRLWSIKRLKNEIKKLDLVLVNAQRIPDYLVIYAANSVGVPVVYLMHGLYIPHMKREIGFYLEKLGKSLRYLLYACSLGFSLKSISLTYKLISNFVVGYPSRNFIRRFSNLQVTTGYIWAEVWREWHEDKWSMRPHEGWKTIGNPDLTRFIWSSYKPNTVTYIYQTLIEDGRIDMNVMLNFYSNLKNVCNVNGLQVNVKWHPRGNIELREVLINHGFSIFDDGSVPIGDVAIGHYSSLLGAFPLMSVPVVIVELPEHKTPVSILEIASQIIGLDKFSETGIQLHESKTSKKVQEKSEKYFGAAPNLPQLEESIMAILENGSDEKLRSGSR